MTSWPPADVRSDRAVGFHFKAAPIGSAATAVPRMAYAWHTGCRAGWAGRSAVELQPLAATLIWALAHVHVAPLPAAPAALPPLRCAQAPSGVIKSKDVRASGALGARLGRLAGYGATLVWPTCLSATVLKRHLQLCARSPINLAQ